MSEIDELISQALLYKCKLHTAQYEYSKSLDSFSAALNLLFLELKQQSDQSEINRLKSLISSLLTQAEQCKTMLNPVQAHHQEVLQSLRPRPVDIHSLLPSPPSSSFPLSTQKPQKSQNPPEKNHIEDPLDTFIESEILDCTKSVKWEDIAGLAKAKSMLHEAVIMPSEFPHLFTGLRAPPKGILLFGPPGTGKTLLAKALASQSSACFFNISASTLTSRYYGEAEKLVRSLFNVSRRKQPSVVFIDEVDSILSARGQGEHEASRRLKTEFLVQMDGVRNADNDRVIIIAATNRPQELDDAVIRRFTKRIYIDLPDEVTREEVISNQMKNVANCLSREEILEVVRMTFMYSGSDLAAVCKEAAMEPLRRVSQEELRKGVIPEVSFESFRLALDTIRPSVSQSSLEFYSQWNKEFGSK